MTGVKGLCELWKTALSFSNNGRFHSRTARAARVTDDIGRFDDESR
jgi:hypothetical protein